MTKRKLASKEEKNGKFFARFFFYFLLALNIESILLFFPLMDTFKIKTKIKFI